MKGARKLYKILDFENEVHGAYINGLNRLEIVQIEDMQCLNIHKGQKVDGEWLIELELEIVVLDKLL